jgi:hypothetical protein
VNPLDENAILNPQAVGRLVATQVVAMAFAAASALDPDDVSLAARATLYAQRLSEVIHATEIVLDLDGDGRPDSVRRLDVINLVRM